LVPPAQYADDDIVAIGEAVRFHAYLFTDHALDGEATAINGRRDVFDHRTDTTFLGQGMRVEVKHPDL
jgi:hypothetical protein